MGTPDSSLPNQFVPGDDEVKVSFISTRNKFGSSATCRAVVDPEFFSRLSTVNQILIQGWNEEKEAKIKKLAKASANRKDTFHDDNFRRLVPSTCSISPYFKDHGGLRRLPEKLLAFIEPHMFEVSCSLDFWIWVEAQRYFQTISPLSVDPSILKLADLGLDAYTQRWYSPLEDLDNQVEVEGSGFETNCDDKLQRSMAIAKRFLDVDDFNGNAKDLEENSLVCGKSDAILDDLLSAMEEELVTVDLRNNSIISTVRMKTVEDPQFWNEHECSTKGNVLENMILKRYCKLKKRKRNK